MRTEADWARWFESYGDFILHYARLAEALGIEALCVGTELHGTIHREREWRALISEVRSVYSGQLTYAANWYEEYEQVPFWDALDWVGIQAYFPLAQADHPGRDSIARGWDRWIEDIGQLAADVGRPVVFTEIGYRSAPGAAREPWIWPTRGESTTDIRDLQVQADAFQAFFDRVWPEPWVQGAYVWKWYSQRTLMDRDLSRDFTPQGKPAEAVLRRAYSARTPSGGR